MASTTTLTRTAREYLRVSQDRSGRLRSPEEQHDENSEHADAEGLTLGTPYRETGAVSASKYGRKTREAFADLLADLEGRTFGAQVLILWESSRGSRKVSEWARLAEAMEDAGVIVYVTSHSRFYDPANGRDRKALMEDAVDAEYASYKQSAGVARAMKANARDGKPHGTIPYGYRRIHDDRTGKLIRQEPEPAESPVVLDIFTRIYEGHSLRSIARSLNERGTLPRNGTPWTEFRIRSIALRPVYAGLRMHNTERGNRRYQPGITQLTEGTWDAIVDPGVFHAVQNILRDPARRTSKPGKAKHLLTILARCGICGEEMTATFRYKTSRGEKTHRAWQLVCRNASHTRIIEEDLDAYVTDEVISYLAKPENYVSGARDTGELAQVKAEIAELSQRREGLTVALANGMDPGQVAKADKLLAARLTELAETERRISTPAALSALVGTSHRAEDIRARWDVAPISARREVVRLVMAGKGVIHVVKHPRPGYQVPAEARVEWRRPEANGR